MTVPESLDSPESPDERVQRLERRVERERQRRLAAETFAERLTDRHHLDVATGLATRVSFLGALAAALDRAAREATALRNPRVGVLVLDLDDFAAVNAVVGTAVADQVLAEVASRLGALARTGDVVARLSGDEFAILMPQADDVDHIRRLADAVAGTLREPCVVEGRSVSVRASMGLRLATAPELAERVLREAEAALYVAKSGGEGRIVAFDTDRARAAERREFELELRRGLYAAELETWFQPVVELPSRKVIGAEALIRWNHPERGFIPPLEFIERAEQAALVDLITDEVLLRSCEVVARWDTVGDETIHVNVASVDLCDIRLIGRVMAPLQKHGVDPRRLCLEITERALVTDNDVAADNLSALRSLGIGLAIDDFGVEYSSFAYLRRFPAEVVKIDRSFVEGIADDPRDRALLSGMVTMARALGMRTVAEGVETEAQCNVLIELGVDEAQGWLFARPAPEAPVPGVSLVGGLL